MRLPGCGVRLHLENVFADSERGNPTSLLKDLLKVIRAYTSWALARLLWHGLGNNGETSLIDSVISSQGLGLSVQGSGFRVWGSGFESYGLGLRVPGKSLFKMASAFSP